jgi:hypothetical protein
MYDPATALFTTQDSYAESYYPFSPYNYVGGNPVTRIDENGEFWHIVIGAAVGAVASTVKCVIDGEDFRKGSTWAKIGLGTATGAAIAAMPFSVGGVVGAGAVSSASDIMEQGIDNAKEGNELLNKDNYNLKKAAFSGLIGSASFGAGGVLARNVRNYAIHRNWTGPLKRNGLLKLFYNYSKSSEIIIGTASSILNTTLYYFNEKPNRKSGQVIVNKDDIDPEDNIKPGATVINPIPLPEVPVYPGSAGPAYMHYINYEQ